MYLNNISQNQVISQQTNQLKTQTNTKQLFRYHIEKNQQRFNNEHMFFYRTNRWRFSSKDYSTIGKTFRVRYQLLICAGSLIAYGKIYLIKDYAIGQYKKSEH